MSVIENVKNPKNAVPWIITGYILVVIGYFVWQKYDSAGRIIGFLGSAAILITLLRLSVTRLWLGVILVAAMVGYGWWYMKSVTIAETTESQVYEHEPWKKYDSTVKRPKYSSPDASPRTQDLIFAPAFMIDSVVTFPRWRTQVVEGRNPDYVPPKN